MNDDTASGQPEGEALPEHLPEPPQGGFFSPDASPAERVSAAVDRWYDAHYHAAALAGRAPLPADDLAALHQLVAEAVAPAAPQE